MCGEAGAGFVVVNGDGLFAEVGGGHHECLHARIGEEQMLQAARRAERCRATECRARPRERCRCGCAHGASTIGRAGVCSRASSSRSQVAEGARCCEIAHHDGEGFAVAVFALSQARDGFLAGGIDAEVEAADAFDGHDFAAKKALDGLRHRVAAVDGSAVGDSSQTRGPHRQQALG